MSEKKNVLIKILEINEISFNHKQLPVPAEEVEFGKNLLFGLGINMGFDFNKELLKLKLLINYNLPEQNFEVLSIEVEIIFHIKNLSAAVRKDKKTNRVDIKDDLLSTLLGVLIGTSRGILSTKTKGTPLAKFPLPIINVKDVLSQIKKAK